MYYVQKYVDNFAMTKTKRSRSSNIILYCNYYSFYSQKVLMALYEKNVDFEPIIIDITKGEQYSSWFIELNPRGEIPVLKVGNRIIPDSTRIIDYLEDHLDPELNSLYRVSEDPKILKDVKKYRELVEALPAGVITVGSFFNPRLCGRRKLPFIQPVREILKNGDLGSANNLRRLAELYPHAKDILLYKADIQERKLEILISETQYLKILNIVDDLLTEVENQLKDQVEGYWLCSKRFSIADISVAVLLQRLWEIGLEDRFWTNGKRPYVENYFNRVCQRESFKKTVPGLTDHFKMVANSQSPVYVGATGVVSVAFVITAFYIIKKIVF